MNWKNDGEFGFADMIRWKTIWNLNTNLLFTRQEGMDGTIWFLWLSPTFGKESVSKMTVSLEHLKLVFKKLLEGKSTKRPPTYF